MIDLMHIQKNMLKILKQYHEKKLTKTDIASDKIYSLLLLQNTIGNKILYNRRVWKNIPIDRQYNKMGS